MVISPGLAEAFEDLIKDVFGRRKGRLVGQIVVLIPFLIFSIVSIANLFVALGIGLAFFA